MVTKLLRSVIMGAPASGKGTISNRIIKYFNVKHLASGDLLRNQIRNETDLGKEAKAYVENGKLVPDNVMVNLIASELTQLSNDNWLLDGFPRTRNQAAELFKKQPVDIALNLVVPFEIIIKRVEGRWIHEKSGRIYNTDFNPPKVKGKDDITGESLIQRPDDTPDAVRKRLEIYSATAKPVLDYFKEIGILKEFYGETSDEIWPHVYKFLEIQKTAAMLARYNFMYQIICTNCTGSLVETFLDNVNRLALSARFINKQGGQEIYANFVASATYAPKGFRKIAQSVRSSQTLLKFFGHYIINGQ